MNTMKLSLSIKENFGFFYHILALHNRTKTHTFMFYLILVLKVLKFISILVMHVKYLLSYVFKYVSIFEFLMCIKY